MNRARIFIGHENINMVLQQGMDMPPGYLVRRMYDDPVRNGTSLIVEGPDIPYTPPGVECPNYQFVEVVDGRFTLTGWKGDYS